VPTTTFYIDHNDIMHVVDQNTGPTQPAQVFASLEQLEQLVGDWPLR
jgi:hypothetical protein